MIHLFNIEISLNSIIANEYLIKIIFIINQATLFITIFEFFLINIENSTPFVKTFLFNAF